MRPWVGKRVVRLFSRRRYEAAAIVAAVGIVVVLVNGYLTQRYSSAHIADMDLYALAMFLGPYAAENNDALPSSWEELVGNGYVQPDAKFAARFARYIENPVVYPDRLRWLANARLRDYVLDQGRLVDRATSRPARLVWLDGVPPARCNESRWNTRLYESWQQWKSHGADKGFAPSNLRKEEADGMNR